MTRAEELAKYVVSNKTQVINGQLFACFGLEEAIAEAISNAVLAEREACIVACKQVRAFSCGSAIATVAANHCVTAIEARKD